MSKKRKIEFHIWKSKITESEVNFCNCITALENVDFNNIRILKEKLVLKWNHRELLLINQDESLKDLRKACKALRLSKAQINQSCGLHVHIDANDYVLEDFKLLVKNWIKIEQSIDEIMPESRRKSNNRYCKTNKILNLDQKLEQASSLGDISRIFGTRFVKMNLESYQRHGTVEFRQHSGSCNYTKIKSWVLICSRLVEASKQGIVINNINQILNDELQEYFEERQLDFV